MKNKKVLLTIVIILLIIIIIILVIFLNKNDYKILNFGNNITSKSIENIERNILNIKSYNAQMDVTVQVNKSINKYKIKQIYIRNNQTKQEILEPKNIEGLQTIYDGQSLKLQNTKMDLNKIYENYKGIQGNILFLSSFIEEYKNSEKSRVYENDNQVILEVSLNNNARYIAHKKLYVNKKTKKPTKLEIKDVTQNIIVYILYNEIEINTMQKNEILAFKLDVLNKEL